MFPRLGVNIDHVATIRQARGEKYPSIVDAAHAALEVGADQLTIHLREDRRHIQDYDVPAVKLVCERYNKPLNLEMAASEEIFEIAASTKPEWICLVPEKREERTTEGGLDLSGENFTRIEVLCAKLRGAIPDVKISLFVEADAKTLENCIKLKADAVEIHTGDYAIHFNQGEDISKYLESYKLAAKLMQDNKIGFHAGHGLDDKNIIPLLELGLFEEYNVGHWIISESLFKGLSTTVSDYLKLMRGYKVSK